MDSVRVTTRGLSEDCSDAHKDLSDHDRGHLSVEQVIVMLETAKSVPVSGGSKPRYPAICVEGPGGSYTFECGKGWIFCVETQAQVSVRKAISLVYPGVDYTPAPLVTGASQRADEGPPKLSELETHVPDAQDAIADMHEFRARVCTAVPMLIVALVLMLALPDGLGDDIFFLLGVVLAFGGVLVLFGVGAKRRKRRRFRWLRDGSEEENDVYDYDGSDGGGFD